MAKKKRRKLPVKLLSLTEREMSWDQMTIPQKCGLMIHPGQTGIGACRRSIADVDYIENCFEVSNLWGTAVFAESLLYMLQGTDEYSWTISVGRTDEFPTPTHIEPRSRRLLPMPRIDNTSQGDQWTAGMVIGIAINPVFTGIGAFPRLVSDQKWVSAFSRMLRQDSHSQTMVDLLYVLRWTFGVPGVSKGNTPYGYRQAEDDSAHEE